MNLITYIIEGTASITLLAYYNERFLAYSVLQLKTPNTKEFNTAFLNNTFPDIFGHSILGFENSEENRSLEEEGFVSNCIYRLSFFSG